MGESTRITVQTQPRPGEARDLFDYLREAIGAKKKHRFHDGPSPLYMPGAHEYAMDLTKGGLPVWLKVFHNNGRLLPPLEDHGTRYVEICLSDGTRPTHDLLLSQISAWMKTRGWKWRWSTGDIDWKEG